MVDEVVRYEVDPDGKFKAALTEAASKVDDLTIPFIAITKDWYRSNTFVFNVTGGPGKWKDYKKNTKGYSPYAKAKTKQFGSPYPMLVHYGLLKNSMTDPADSATINQIVNKKSLMLGTKIPYAPYLQLGTKWMVARPFMFIGGEQTAPDRLQTRRDNWINIVNDYVKQVTRTVGEYR
jgi:hypothetical protein